MQLQSIRYFLFSVNVYRMSLQYLSLGIESNQILFSMFDPLTLEYWVYEL